MKKILIIAFFFWLLSSNSFAWDGYDAQNDSHIEIGKGNYVAEGRNITFYDWKDGQYHDAEVKFIGSSFNATRVEVYDMTDKKDRTFDME